MDEWISSVYPVSRNSYFILQKIFIEDLWAVVYKIYTFLLIGEELIRKWQADYMKEKQVEYETKKAERNKEKKSKNATQDAAVKDEKVDDEPVESLPLGAVLYMDGFKNDTMREDIKKELDCDDAIGKKHALKIYDQMALDNY